MHGGHRVLDGAQDAQRPPCVLGDLDRVGLDADERMAGREEGVEGAPFEEVHDEEAVLAEGEPVAHGGGDAEAAHLLQGRLLALQAGHRVRAVRREAGVGPGFLEDDAFAGAGVGSGVDAAAVGEVQGPFDAVGQFTRGGGVTGGEVGREELGQGDPVGDVEDRVPRSGTSTPSAFSTAVTRVPFASTQCRLVKPP